MMSNVPANASTIAPPSRLPNPISTAATQVISVPPTVTMLGVTGSRPSRRPSRSALRLTHAWKRVVSTRLDLLHPGRPGRFLGGSPQPDRPGGLRRGGPGRTRAPAGLLVDVHEPARHDR